MLSGRASARAAGQGWGQGQLEATVRFHGRLYTGSNMSPSQKRRHVASVSSVTHHFLTQIRTPTPRAAAGRPCGRRRGRGSGGGPRAARGDRLQRLGGGRVAGLLLRPGHDGRQHAGGHRAPYQILLQMQDAHVLAFPAVVLNGSDSGCCTVNTAGISTRPQAGCTQFRKQAAAYVVHQHPHVAKQQAPQFSADAIACLLTAAAATGQMPCQSL